VAVLSGVKKGEITPIAIILLSEGKTLRIGAAIKLTITLDKSTNFC
jgi:hypothetical protein